VIEAVFEDIGVKEQVFRKLDEVDETGRHPRQQHLDARRRTGSRISRSGPRTSSACTSSRPANVMKLLEVVRGAATARDVLATVMKLAKTIRKTAAVSGVCDGFIGNRMIEHYGASGDAASSRRAPRPGRSTRRWRSWGMAMGPFRMGDLAGNDIGWAIRKRRYVEKPDVKYAKIADKLCELGRFGQKTGMGWYRYEAGKRDAIPDPVVDKLIEDYRKEKGITPRKISDEEIVERCIFALVNEAARLLEEGIAQRASDVDMVYLTGYGFPLHRGGPMLYADQVGLYNVAARPRSASPPSRATEILAAGAAAGEARRSEKRSTRDQGRASADKQNRRPEGRNLQEKSQ
jgi:3-hydroxyacyl-CoA dehydrogenase